jgi:uncharacterized protein (TIGR01244 family)
MKRNRDSRVGLLLLLSVVFTGISAEYSPMICAAESEEESRIVSIELGETLNAKTLKKKIFFAGQLAEPDFKTLSEWGVKTVVNFRSRPEVEHLPFDEKKVVEALGMTYLHIPIGRERLDDSVLDKIVRTIGKSKEKKKKVMLHCASSDRVGFAWSLYIGATDADIEAAIIAGKEAGLRSPGLEARAREYIQKRKSPARAELSK